ncbi:MAG TPA: polysaccharide deacetylase family protein [Fimbriimonadaceae bacterium]|nr:polysaccharide deacetylase family protein [Fimbriimonadaceae bacterium]
MRWRSPVLILAGALFGAASLAAVIKLRKSIATPTYDLRDDILVHGNLHLKEIALTIDDGPRPETMREMLNILGREKVKATFFVVGKQVEQHPALVRRMMNEGHEVGNHTHSHPRLAGLDAEEIRREIVECNRAIREATGANSNLFRPPGMRYDDVVIDTAQSLRYVTIHWNVAARDFERHSPDWIAERVIRQTSPGSVILLHGHPDTVAALPTILSTLKSRGYRFVTVSQMLSRLPRPVYVKTNAWGVDPSFIARTREPQADPRPDSLRSPTPSSRERARSRPKAGGRIPASPPAAPAVVDAPAWGGS